MCTFVHMGRLVNDDDDDNVNDGDIEVIDLTALSNIVQNSVNGRLEIPATLVAQ